MNAAPGFPIAMPGLQVGYFADPTICVLPTVSDGFVQPLYWETPILTTLEVAS